LGGDDAGTTDDSAAPDGFDSEGIIADPERLGCIGVEDAEIDGRVDIAGEVGEEMAVEINVGFARAGDVESRGTGNAGEVETSAKEVRVSAELREIPGKVTTVATADSNVA
jgi:hypothetical protein